MPLAPRLNPEQVEAMHCALKRAFVKAQLKGASHYEMAPLFAGANQALKADNDKLRREIEKLKTSKGQR